MQSIWSLFIVTRQMNTTLALGPAKSHQNQVADSKKVPSLSGSLLILKLTKMWS